jgi:hypothetical protein
MFNPTLKTQRKPTFQKPRVTKAIVLNDLNKQSHPIVLTNKFPSTTVKTLRKQRYLLKQFTERKKSESDSSRAGTDLLKRSAKNISPRLARIGEKGLNERSSRRLLERSHINLSQSPLGQESGFFMPMSKTSFPKKVTSSKQILAQPSER